MLTTSEQYLINKSQAMDLPSALAEAESCFSCYRHASRITKRFWRLLGHAYLNRACELACVPLTQYYAESSRGDLDLVWVTYRPRACKRMVYGYMGDGTRIPVKVETVDPVAMVYLGAVDTLTEDQARSRAIGW